MLVLTFEFSGENLVPKPASKREETGEQFSTSDKNNRGRFHQYIYMSSKLSFGRPQTQMCQVKKRDDLIHKENKLEVGGIPVHPGHMAAMQGLKLSKKKK